MPPWMKQSSGRRADLIDPFIRALARPAVNQATCRRG